MFLATKLFKNSLSMNERYLTKVVCLFANQKMNEAINDFMFGQPLYGLLTVNI